MVLRTPVSSTNKTDRHDMTEILLKVALNNINQTNPINIKILIRQPLYENEKLLIECKETSTL